MNVTGKETERVWGHKAQTSRREIRWGIEDGKKFCFFPSVRFVNEHQKSFDSEILAPREGFDFEMCYFSHGMRYSGARILSAASPVVYHSLFWLHGGEDST